MGCEMMHRDRTHRGDERGMDGMCIPAPMAFFGMAAAFMWGAIIGTVVAKKSMVMHGAMMQGMPAHGGMGHGMGMHGGRGIRARHHHHGWGMPPCRGKHGWEETGTSAEEPPEGSEEEHPEE